MRRIILEEPFSAAAIWSRRLALFAIALGVIAIGLVRSGASELSASMSVFAFAILSACAAVLSAGAAAATIWRTGRRGMGVVTIGIALAALVLAWPTWLVVKAASLPMLNDVTTDLNDPPYFSRSAKALAARKGHVPGEIGQELRREQARAYPNVQPITLDLEAAEAFQLVLKAAGALGWEVVDQVAPSTRRGDSDGRIDAVQRTLVMRFPDDLAIRVRPLVGQTRIDVRSVSRYGRHDFGVNAKRIETFAREMQTQLDGR